METSSSKRATPNQDWFQPGSGHRSDHAPQGVHRRCPPQPRIDRCIFKHKDQLYTQICLTKGCELCPTACTAFLLDGLQRGAYQDILKVCKNRILLGQGKLKHTSPLTELQQAAINLLVTSQIYKDNVIQAGKKAHSPSAHAVTTSSPTATGSSSTASHTPCNGPLIEEIIQELRSGQGLTTTRTSTFALSILAHTACPTSTSMRNAALFARNSYYIRPKGPRPDSTSSSTPGGKETAAKASVPKEPTSDDSNKETAKAAAATPATQSEQEEAKESDAYKSDDGFICEYGSDPELMSELTQQASRAASDQTIQAKLSNRGSSTWVNRTQPMPLWPVPVQRKQNGRIRREEI
jgi:hypothetical protein